MKAVRWHGRKDLRFEEVPSLPPPQKGWARVRVKACGICGSDLHEYENGPIATPNKTGPRHKLPPIIMGHEFSGIVEEFGPETTGPAPGTTVIVDASLTCGECYYCRIGRKILCVDRGVLGRTLDGGFAEYANVPAQNCYPASSAVFPEILALAEPLTVAIHGVNRGLFRKGEKGTVIGGGPIGLMVARVLFHRGAGDITLVEPVTSRRNLADRVGAHHTIDPNKGNVIDEVRQRTAGVGADVVFECVGSVKTYQLAIQLARKGGRIVILGATPEPTPINFREILISEKEIIGSLGRGDDWDEAVELLTCYPEIWQSLVSSKISLEETPGAFEKLLSQPHSGPGQVKVMVCP
jgi:(R,R)-butanediol dehydrogenase / meso-butanediol dehydrogenase / diacetyl reductase